MKEATSYIAYSGPLHVDEDKRTRTHSRFVSLFPNWTGQTQPRAALASDAAKSISGQTIPIDGDSKAAE
ncbi:MAG: hypothetical protein EPN51_16515 [Mycobacterium sp.]|nr:MAG: hypothetical protein EPN51_16515 [Mycobacterium sp.]